MGALHRNQLCPEQRRQEAVKTRRARQIENQIGGDALDVEISVCLDRRKTLFQTFFQTFGLDTIVVPWRDSKRITPSEPVDRKIGDTEQQ